MIGHRHLWLWLLLAPVAGCGQPVPGDVPLRPSQVKSFAPLFEQHCAGCHGRQGKNGAAPPLNDRLFLGVITDDQLKETISSGRPGTLMPAFGQEQGGPLTAEQIQVLVQGVRRWGRPNPDLKDYAAALAEKAEGDAAAGARVYERACAACHGRDGRGPLPLNDRAFLALMSNQALRRIAFTGRPDLKGMPDYRDSTGRGPGFQPLSPQDIADLGALFASWRSAGGVADQAAK
jgi:mono/diheme cytochrome c family protein